MLCMCRMSRGVSVDPTSTPSQDSLLVQVYHMSDVLFDAVGTYSSCSLHSGVILCCACVGCRVGSVLTPHRPHPGTACWCKCIP